MKELRFTFLAFIVLLTTLLSCEKPVPTDDNTPPEIEFSNKDLNAHWQLTHLNGQEVFEDTMLYIFFDVDEHRYEMWDNIGSMYMHQTTGSYSLTTEDDDTYTLSGTYDNGAGDWNETYRVVMLSNMRMQWRSRTTSTCFDFKITMDVPDEFFK